MAGSGWAGGPGAAQPVGTGAQGAAAGTPPPPVPGAPLVALRGITFRYPSSQGGVSDLTFDLPTGEVTALTGASGAGKSTTADIVLGLLEPDAGEVLIEGHPLTRAGLRAWRARVAYVPQETILIPGSLRRNLLWSVGEASDEACWAALDRAAAGFARSLPDGLDTLLGDRGIRLSGGERQRVAIARALLREPDLLVLDEATSSLDDATEAAVLELMASLGPAVTVLVIAHRRSTIEAAGHVVELAAGRAVGVAAAEGGGVIGGPRQVKVNIHSRTAEAIAARQVMGTLHPCEGVAAVADISSWLSCDEEPLGARDEQWVAPDPLDESTWWLWRAGLARSIPEPQADCGPRSSLRHGGLLAIPDADVQFATWHGERGVISEYCPRISSTGTCSSQDCIRTISWRAGTGARACLDSIRQAWSPTGRWSPDLSGFEGFVSYLVFDALIGNTDRHHENWAVDRRSGCLARATTTGHPWASTFHLRGARRRGLRSKGKARHFPGKPTLVDLASHGLSIVRDETAAQSSNPSSNSTSSRSVGSHPFPMSGCQPVPVPLWWS